MESDAGVELVVAARTKEVSVEAEDADDAVVGMTVTQRRAIVVVAVTYEEQRRMARERIECEDLLDSIDLPHRQSQDRWLTKDGSAPRKDQEQEKGRSETAGDPFEAATATSWIWSSSLRHEADDEKPDAETTFLVIPQTQNSVTHSTLP